MIPDHQHRVQRLHRRWQAAIRTSRPATPRSPPTSRASSPPRAPFTKSTPGALRTHERALVLHDPPIQRRRVRRRHRPAVARGPARGHTPAADLRRGLRSGPQHKRRNLPAAGCRPCTRRSHSCRAEIQGWYFHPYGPPRGSGLEKSLGIQSVPEVQRLMTSGQNNIIVSEVGYCAPDVSPNANCSGPRRGRKQHSGGGVADRDARQRPALPPGGLAAGADRLLP